MIIPFVSFDVYMVGQQILAMNTAIISQVSDCRVHWSAGPSSELGVRQLWVREIHLQQPLNVRPQGGKAQACGLCILWIPFLQEGVCPTPEAYQVYYYHTTKDLYTYDFQFSSVSRGGRMVMADIIRVATPFNINPCLLAISAAIGLFHGMHMRKVTSGQAPLVI